MKRMEPFLFIVIRRDDTREFATFYASSPRQATQYARAWAQRLGHRRVELQAAENAA